MSPVADLAAIKNERSATGKQATDSLGPDVLLVDPALFALVRTV